MKEFKEYRSMHEILAEFEELRQKIFLLETLYTESEGEVTPEIQALEEEIKELSAINENDFVNKAEAYYYVIADYEGKAEIEKRQKERFEKREEALTKSAGRLKSIIDTAMEKYGKDDPKSTAKIPSKKLNAGSVSITAIAYPILDPTTVPPTEKLVAELGEQYVDSKLTWNLTPDEADTVKLGLQMYNDKVGSKTNKLAPIPDFVPTLNTNRVKDALKNGISVGEIKLLNNFKSRFK